MQKDFHYYAAYCAAYIAGYSHEESLDIAYCDQFVDLCSVTLLKKLHAPLSAATTQLQLEMMDMKTDLLGLQEITRIWASFHFLPYDLNAELKRGGRRYKNKYRLICDSNSDLLIQTVKLAKNQSLQAVGLAMHVLSDTWAHKYFIGTPSLVFNNTTDSFYEIFNEDGKEVEKKIVFSHNPKSPDNLEKSKYVNSLYQRNENSIMNLGHGRAGHLPDYSFIKYKYLPAWGEYNVIVKDNPSDYIHAFCQMIYAMKFIRGINSDFEKNQYDFDAIEKYKDRIDTILRKRQIDACDDWKAFAEELSGKEIPDFDFEKYQEEYEKAGKESKDDTFIGKFIIAALAQKSMVSSSIFKTGSMLAGFSVDTSKGLKAFRDYMKVAKIFNGGKENE